MKKRLFVSITFYSSLFLQTIAVYLYFNVFANTQIAEYIFLITKLLLLLIPILCYQAGMKFLPAINKEHILASIIQGGISGMGMAAFIFLIYTLFTPFFDGYRENILIKIQDFNVQNWYMGYALIISFFHSAFEEYFWRWYILSGLNKRMTIQWAALFSSIFFSLHHYFVLTAFFPPLIAFFGTLAVAIGGYMWCIMYVQTKNIMAPWISHVLVDLILYYIGYLIVFA